jgi:hypothetical protein
MSGPDTPSILIERSHPLFRTAASAGLTIVDCLVIGLSPLAFQCTQKWVPLLEWMCPQFGYVFEWVSTDYREDAVFEEYPYLVRDGEAVLTKVDKCPT